MTLPAAASEHPGHARLRPRGRGAGRLARVGVGRRAPRGPGRATGDGTDFRLADRSPARFAALAAGAVSPLRLMMQRRLHVERQAPPRAASCARWPADVDIAEVSRPAAGSTPTSIYRALPYLVDPEWTRGHEFTVALRGDRRRRRRWHVEVRDGERLRVHGARDGRRADRHRDGLDLDTYARMVTGALTPDRGDAAPAASTSRASSTRSRCSAAGSTARRAATTPSSSARSASARCSSGARHWGGVTRAAHRATAGRSAA